MKRPRGARRAGDGRARARILGERGLAGLVVVVRSARDPDLAPFVGPVHLGSALLILPAAGAPRLAYFSPMEREEAAATGLELLSPAALELEKLAKERPDPAQLLAAVLARALEASGVAEGRLALAGRAPAGVVHAACAALAPRFAFAAGAEPLRLLLKRKTEEEIRAIREAAAGACAALRAVARLLAAAGVERGELWLGGERLRVARLRREIALQLAERGLGEPEGNIVAPGPEGAVPHSRGRDERALRPGESLIVDVFPRGWFFADCTRTFCCGAPPAALPSAHAAVGAALAEARSAALPGVRGWALHEGVCALLAGRGYPTAISHPGTTAGYVHGLGHGVGSELHEFPSFRKESGEEGVLAAGDVFTLEPGLYDPEAGWAVRLEDLFVMAAAGPEPLTDLPHELDPRAWG